MSTMIQDSQELKALGNKSFQTGDFEDAVTYYTQAIDLSDNKNNKMVYFKNRAACYLKQNKPELAVKDTTNALDICPTDTKALFRRVQALEMMNQLSGAYTDARRMLQIDPKNTAVINTCQRLRGKMEVQMFQERSTENRVTTMLKILFDSSQSTDKKQKAAENLVVLSRDDAGAERIFREGGPQALADLLDSPDYSVKLAAVRTLSGICTGHQSRSLVILRDVGTDRFCQCMGDLEGSDELSMATFHLFQCIIKAIQDEHKREPRNKDQALKATYNKDLFMILVALNGMLLSEKVSGEGRDNAISLIAKNVPRDDIRYRTNARTMKFLEMGGVKSLLTIASYGHSPKDSPFATTNNTRLNCAVALSKLYDDLGGDLARSEWDEMVKEYVQEYFKAGEVTSSVRALSAITCLLQGPFDCGQKLLGMKGVMETMVAMTAAEDEPAQVAAVEAIITSTSQKSRASFVIENGVSLLKELYKSANSSDAVKVRALVGLCKLGSSHGSDVSMRAFADGSTIKLAKQCRKFLTNPMKNFDLRKWAAEGLSFLTLDADVKEELCEDKEALKALFELGQTNDKTVMYGVVSCLVNTTNTFDKGDEITPEMLELAKYAKHHIPEQHEKDKPEFVKARIDKLVESGMVHALVNLSNTDSAILTDTSKELLCRVFLASVENEANRGEVVAAGGGKALIPLAKEGTKKGKRLAAHAIAKIGITQNPAIAFPGQRSLECIKALKEGLHPDCESIQNFETLMALTNFASMDETHRMRIINAKILSDIESYMFEEHLLLRRAATQCMCNMAMSPQVHKLMEKENHDKIKLLVLLLAEEDEDTRLAAAGGLAILTSNSEIVCKRIRNSCDSWLDNLSYVALEENLAIRLRGVVIIQNVVHACKETAELIAKENIFEILMAHSKATDPKEEKIKEIAIETLKKLEEDQFIQSTNGNLKPINE